jgi:hypothetical protein
LISLSLLNFLRHPINLDKLSPSSKLAFTTLILAKIELNSPIIYEKIKHPNKSINATNTLSYLFRGFRSPNPVVDSEVKA